MEANPGHVAAELPLALPRPRQRDTGAGARAGALVRQALHAAPAL